jgi:hypothetical protein
MQGALFLESESHFLDHLATTCALLKIPCLFADVEVFNLAKKIYKVDGQLIDPSFLNSDLLNAFDTLYIPLISYAKDLKNYAKNTKFIYHPHGFSDKLRKQDILDHSILDDFFIYGPFDEMLYRKYHLNCSYFALGNIRYLYYFENQIFLDTFFNHLPQAFYLYCPTWNDPKCGTSFFDCLDDMIHSLPSDEYLVVKLHPNLFRFDHLRVMQMQLKYESRPNVFFIENFPLIFPLLNRAKALISDHSAICYDFFLFDKPVYFLTKKITKMHQFGLVVKEIKELFKQNPIKQARPDSIFKSYQNCSAFKKAFSKSSLFTTLKS